MNDRVRLLAAVTWPVRRSPGEDLHPGDYVSSSGCYWFFRHWPSRYEIRVVGVQERNFAAEIERKLPVKPLSAARIIYAARECDIVVVNGSTLGLPVACLLGRFSKKKIVLIDNAMSMYLGGRSRLANMACTAMVGGADLVICHSKGQIPIYQKYLQTRSTRFTFVPYGVSQEEIQTRKEPSFGDYLFAGGNAFRDYKTLCKAVEATGIRVRIASARFPVSAQEVPEEVQLLGRIAFGDYKEVMAQSRLVVVPLEDLPVSAGQLAIAQAMGMGKVVVATDTVGTRDYIANGITGFLVPPNDSDELRKCIMNIWYNNELLERIGKAALEHATTTLTERNMSLAILRELEKIT